MADYLQNRRQVWRYTGAKDDQGKRTCVPTGYDVGEFNGQEVFEPTINVFGIYKSGQVTDRVYTGVMFIDSRDLTLAAPQGPGFGGMKPLLA